MQRTILDWLPKLTEDNRSFWHFWNIKAETRGKDQEFFGQLVLVWQKLVPVVLADLLGLAFLRNHLFEKWKISSYNFPRSSKLSIFRCRDQNLARSLQIVFYRYKLLRCELVWRKQFGTFAGRHIWKWIKKGVNFFCISWIQGSDGKKILSSILLGIEINR